MIDARTAVDERLEAPLAALGGGDAVGVVGADVPIAVLLASGRPFGHLPWRAAEPTPWADAWLESSFPFWARSILEQWHEGAFDALHSVVFSRAEDASQRLFYYVRELQRRRLLGGPKATMLDVALVPKESSMRHTAAAILELAAWLGVSSAALREGIARAQRLQATVALLQSRRSADGPLHERLARAVLWSDPTQWIDDIAVPDAAGGRRRVLLAGSMPPDDRLHRAVESAGASVVAEAHAQGLGRLAMPMPVVWQPPECSLAEHLARASVGPRAFLDRAQWIVQQTATARAAAVILWLTREDEALTWHVPAQRRALAAARIPHLVLPAARWQCDDGALERVAEFCADTFR